MSSLQGLSGAVWGLPTLVMQPRFLCFLFALYYHLFLWKGTLCSVFVIPKGSFSYLFCAQPDVLLLNFCSFRLSFWARGGSGRRVGRFMHLVRQGERKKAAKGACNVVTVVGYMLGPCKWFVSSLTESTQNKTKWTKESTRVVCWCLQMLSLHWNIQIKQMWVNFHLSSVSNCTLGFHHGWRSFLARPFNPQSTWCFLVSLWLCSLESDVLSHAIYVVMSFNVSSLENCRNCSRFYYLPLLIVFYLTIVKA